jgi:opacity protein-like surface antigen
MAWIVKANMNAPNRTRTACIRSTIALIVSAAAGQSLSAQFEGPGIDYPQEARSFGVFEFTFGLTLFTAPGLERSNVNLPNLGTFDAVMNMDDSLLFGFGFGYGLTEKLNLNGELNFGQVDYQMEWGPYALEGTGDMFSGRINLDYNILSTPLTPFITGGIGFTYFDSGVPTGETEVVCWWDDWWGYVCEGTASTYSASEFTYNAGLGLRWDVTDSVFMKFLYDIMWMEVGASGTEAFPQYQLIGGLKW